MTTLTNKKLSAVQTEDYEVAQACKLQLAELEAELKQMTTPQNSRILNAAREDE